MNTILKALWLRARVRVGEPLNTLGGANGPSGSSRIGNTELLFRNQEVWESNPAIQVTNL